MGAWIEISVSHTTGFVISASHPTMGAWIEIASARAFSAVSLGRTPRWVRGLKYFLVLLFQLLVKSHPTMGAWIEINNGTVMP